jgi:hypothetical protein
MGALRFADLGLPVRLSWGSDSTTNGRACFRGPANEASSRLAGLSSWWPSPQAPSCVILAGHATSVPFTPVLTGPERTTTDNTTAALTCAHHHFPR